MYDSSKPVTGGSLIAADIRENFRALKEDEIVAAANVPDGSISVTKLNTDMKDRTIKAWINFNGVTVVIKDSYNVASIVDNGVGIYTINWDTDFANTNYSCVALSEQPETGISDMGADKIKINTYNKSGEISDSFTVCLIAVGDQ